MTNLKGPISVLIVAVLAFAWGYKKDDINFDISSWFSSNASSSPAPSPKTTATEEKLVDKSPSNPYKALSAERKNIARKQKSRPPNKRSRRTDMYGGNPPGSQFQRNNRGVGSPNGRPFGGTLDSIHRNGINPKQTTRRNLYFEKLSEQMKALKGEQHPPPPRTRVKERGLTKEEQNTLKDKLLHAKPNISTSPPPTPQPEIRDLPPPEFDLPEDIIGTDPALDIDEIKELEEALGN